MSKHLMNEIEDLKKSLLELGGLAEDSVTKAIRAVSTRDPKLAKQVIEQDHKIDMLEVEIEEDCLKILALYQPVATDLRFLVSVLKINNDLERIADLSVNIAQRAKTLAENKDVSLPFDFEAMAKTTRTMLKMALDSIIEFDSKKAEDVCRMDNQVDDLHRDTYKAINSGIQKDPSKVDVMIHCLSISRNLERIADYATNIAEDVIYLIDGKIVRHFGDLGEKTSTSS